MNLLLLWILLFISFLSILLLIKRHGKKVDEERPNCITCQFKAQYTERGNSYARFSMMESMGHMAERYQKEVDEYKVETVKLKELLGKLVVENNGLKKELKKWTDPEKVQFT